MIPAPRWVMARRNAIHGPLLQQKLVFFDSEVPEYKQVALNLILSGGMRICAVCIERRNPSGKNRKMLATRAPSNTEGDRISEGNHAITETHQRR